MPPPESRSSATASRKISDGIASRPPFRTPRNGAIRNMPEKMASPAASAYIPQCIEEPTGTAIHATADVATNGIRWRLVCTEGSADSTLLLMGLRIGSVRRQNWTPISRC